MNVLVAVDLSLASEKVVEAARDVAEKQGAKVYVVHVAEPDPEPTPIRRPATSHIIPTAWPGITRVTLAETDPAR